MSIKVTSNANTGEILIENEGLLLNLQNEKDFKKNKINQNCNQEIKKGFSSNALGQSEIFDCEEYDQRNVDLMCSMAISNKQGYTNETLYCKVQGNGRVECTNDQAIQIASDMHKHITGHLRDCTNKKTLIDNASTLQEVEEV